MQFDLFHSLGRVDSVEPVVDDLKVFQQFFKQVTLAEKLGFDTVWIAESHFSSEVQKCHSEAVIVNYDGELGLNCDFGQLAQAIFQRTEKINFGTAIHNIVGGNGGPIASADRVRSLEFYNQLLENPRELYIGVASGRFPYINKPFGIVPRNDQEKLLWPQYKRLIFLEAYEIFYRLCRGETLSSPDITSYDIDGQWFKTEDEYKNTLRALEKTSLIYDKRWTFEPMKLVPELPQELSNKLHFILGSHDPKARELAFKLGSPDIFNLSFTPPDKLNAIHDQMTELCSGSERPWRRSRLPRTVLVFIDENQEVAQKRAEDCFDTYIAAMQGTVVMPPREALMERALIGTPEKIVDDIQDVERHGFHEDDRLMIWIEFNQKEYDSIHHQMTLFAEKVMAPLS